MTRAELIERLSQLIAEKEGFFVTEEKAKSRNMRFPTRAQINANPGNIRVWRNAKRQPYPALNGYVDFVAWAKEQMPGISEEDAKVRGLEEGWRVLRVLATQYVDGRYTKGDPPTAREMFSVYAPAEDNNDPVVYADFVAKQLGARPDQRLIDLVTA